MSGFGDTIADYTRRFNDIAHIEGTEAEQVMLLREIYYTEKAWYQREAKDWNTFELQHSEIKDGKIFDMKKWLALHTDAESYMVFRAPKRKFIICVKDPDVAVMFRLTWL